MFDSAAYARAWRRKNPERSRASLRRYYESHKGWYRAYLKKRKATQQAFVDAAMALGCVDCGNKNLSVLDLDHVRGVKVLSVSSMIGYSYARLFAEIDKCETRCKNCHKLATDERRKAAA